MPAHRVVRVGVTRHPTDAGIARQLHAATPCDRHPRYRIRDNDRKYGRAVARVVAATGLTARRTATVCPDRTPPACASSAASGARAWTRY